MLRKAACLAAFLAVTAAPVYSAGPNLCALSSKAQLPGITQGALDVSQWSVRKPGDSPAKATCIASCSPYASVSCSYTPPSQCTAVDRDCNVFQTGYVQCGSGPRIYCSPECPECTNGQIQFQPTGNCCENGLTEKDKLQCIDGHWEYIGTFCKIPFCGPF